MKRGGRERNARGEQVIKNTQRALFESKVDVFEIHPDCNSRQLSGASLVISQPMLTVQPLTQGPASTVLAPVIPPSLPAPDKQDVLHAQERLKLQSMCSLVLQLSIVNRSPAAGTLTTLAGREPTTVSTQSPV